MYSIYTVSWFREECSNSNKQTFPSHSRKNEYLLLGVEVSKYLFGTDFIGTFVRFA